MEILFEFAESGEVELAEIKNELDVYQNIIDEVVITLFHKNQSFTGEETVEISCHGSKYIQNKILELLINSSVRLANPGEYTMRAFKNGKLDLSQAESIADLIESESEAAHNSAIQHLRGGFSKKLQHE